MGMMDKLAAKKQILDSSKRLISYMTSVDDSLKKLEKAFNENVKILATELEKYNKRLDSIEGKLKNGTCNNPKN